MDEMPAWTLEELILRAATALRSSPGAREPDVRAVRWYASIGLVDRPVGGRGRGARYGPRHLCQLVAVRRLQAEGWSLADIQGRLAGADDEALRSCAALPEAFAEAPTPAGLPSERVDATFWKGGRPIVLGAEPRHGAPSASSSAAAPNRSPRPVVEPVPAPSEVGAIRLAEGVVLVLPRQPSAVELSALAESAAPLVAALVRLGLSVEPSSPSTVSGGPS